MPVKSLAPIQGTKEKASWHMQSGSIHAHAFLYCGRAYDIVAGSVLGQWLHIHVQTIQTLTSSHNKVN
jgi:hypothetical protein